VTAETPRERVARWLPGMTSGISGRAGAGSGESFAGILTPVVEVVDVHRHAAENLYAMLRDYGDRENRQLVAAVVGQCVVDVFAERDDAQQLAALPLLPAQAHSGPRSTRLSLQVSGVQKGVRVRHKHLHLEPATRTPDNDERPDQTPGRS
jgi:hypothetical protein